jgi:hypothetical protein
VTVGPSVAVFVIRAVVSLATSWVLVTRLERVGERLGFSEASLGIAFGAAAIWGWSIPQELGAVFGHPMFSGVRFGSCEQRIKLNHRGSVVERRAVSSEQSETPPLLLPHGRSVRNRLRAIEIA